LPHNQNGEDDGRWSTKGAAGRACRYIEMVNADERVPMSSTSDPTHLSGHHRDTLLQIFQEPTGHNVEWHDVMSLLGAIGSIENRHDDMFVFRIGADSEVMQRSDDKDIDGQQLVDLRRLLANAGYDAVAAKLEAEGKEA
jgi:hypothetical protein